MGSSNSKGYKIGYKERPKEKHEKEIEVEKKGENDKEVINKEEINIEEKNKTQNIEKKNILKNGKKDLAKENGKMVTVIIPLNYGSWENSYNIETPLSQVASDFKIDNNMKSIQKNHYIEFSFKNEPIEMNFNQLKHLMYDDMTTIHIAQEIKPIPGTEKLDENEATEIVAKPFSDPFQLFTFEIRQKTMKILLFNYEKIKQKGLDKFGIDSAYCNGNNYLYISGGLDQATNETIGLFWAIDLKTKIFDEAIEMIPKKNHSMIYSERKVYIIGGDDVNTMFYDVDNKEIQEWENLNYKRFEPSLIKQNNYLFCFDTSKKFINTFENTFNFERIDLYYKDQKWEVIKPQVSPIIKNNVFCQKFFGVVEDYRKNIIFIGGIYDNDNKDNDLKDNDYINLQYNSNTNTIEKSDIEFKDISFTEKTFLPYDNKTYYILPNFNKRTPKIIYFYKDRNIIDVNSYHPNSHSKKKYKVKTTQIKPSLNGLNFDMPKYDDNPYGTYYLKNNNKDNNLTSNYILNTQKRNEENELDFNNNYNKTVRNINEYPKINRNSYIENKQTNELDNVIKMENNISNIESNHDKQTNSSKKEDINNIADIDIKIKSENGEINVENEETDGEKEEENKSNNINLNKEEEEIIKNNSEKIEENIENNNIHSKNSLKDNNSKYEKEENNKKIIKNHTQEKNIQQYYSFNIEDKVNINNIETNTVPKIIQVKQNGASKMIYFEKNEVFSKYHSSLDNRFNTTVYNSNVIQNIKKKRNHPPIEVENKALRKQIKKQIKKINKTEYSEFRKNKNY